MNSYERITKFVPMFYLDVFEMDAIYRVDGMMLDKLKDDVNQVKRNRFIDSADEQTIAELENFFEISVPTQRSLEERKRIIKSYFAGGGKISATVIKAMLKQYTDTSVDCTFEPFDVENNNRLNIYIGISDQTLYPEDLYMLLSPKLPSHIVYMFIMNGEKSTTNDIFYAMPVLQHAKYSIDTEEVEHSAEMSLYYDTPILQHFQYEVDTEEYSPDDIPTTTENQLGMTTFENFVLG